MCFFFCCFFNFFNWIRLGFLSGHGMKICCQLLNNLKHWSYHIQQSFKRRHRQNKSKKIRGIFECPKIIATFFVNIRHDTELTAFIKTLKHTFLLQRGVFLSLSFSPDFIYWWFNTISAFQRKVTFARPMINEVWQRKWVCRHCSFCNLMQLMRERSKVGLRIHSVFRNNMRLLFVSVFFLLKISDQRFTQVPHIALCIVEILAAPTVSLNFCWPLTTFATCFWFNQVSCFKQFHNYLA